MRQTGGGIGSIVPLTGRPAARAGTGPPTRVCYDFDQMDSCILRGVRTHNLKGIDVSIPFGRLTVITGVSGSGKSSLAFDTIYAEGNRRFVDCLSTYARQFLERLDRPDAAFIGRLEPPLALRQSVSVRNARSTVGTLTEIADHLHLLYTHAGEMHCHACGAPVAPETVESAVERILSLPPEVKLCVIAPLARDRIAPLGVGGLIRQGYARVWLEGEARDWPDEKITGSTIEVVVDRFPRKGVRRSRVSEAVQNAWGLAAGAAYLYEKEGLPSRGPIMTLREGIVCGRCGTVGEPPRPALFSGNSPLGACPDCQGFGRTITIDRDKVIPNPRLSLREHAVVPFRMPSNRWFYRQMIRSAKAARVRLDVPWTDLPAREREWVQSGDERFPGIDGLFSYLEKRRYKMHVRVFLARFRGYVPCPACHGTRLKPAALAVRIGGKNIAELSAASIRDLVAFFHAIRLDESRRARVTPVLAEIRSRLECLDEVGLGYLSLSRSARTLSGGETQRLRLASGLGAALTRTLYILDEPTVGLHALDASRVLAVVKRLCKAGNTAIVVEHDPAIIDGADHLIVLGPDGGENGGALVYEGPPRPFLKRHPGFFRVPATPRISAPVRRGAPRLRLSGLRAHNLRIESLSIPLEGIIAISGVSGSGKSTLLDEVIHRNWLRYRGEAVEDVGRIRAAQGYEQLDDVVLIGQEPLGRSVRSNALTFVGAFPAIRDLFSKNPAARALGLKPRDFSFNVPGGRCEVCKGLGTTILEMHFLPDIEVTCEACRGKRFREEVLEVSFRGRSILQTLEMTADEAARFFADVPEIVRRLAPLQEVGLGYLRLGQPTSTLSGGEAQRVKLASFLAEGSDSQKPLVKRLFLFDEPTTGLHARDVGRLLEAIRALIRRGHSVVVVEHHLDFIAASDWVIDLGPGAGDEGGRVVYQGPVEGLKRSSASSTGRAFSGLLPADAHVPAPGIDRESRVALADRHCKLIR
jgi:excinuclease ABC subunit A